jgi:hypothetical protein
MAERRVADLDTVIETPLAPSRIAVLPTVVETYLKNLKGSLGLGTERARSLLARLLPTSNPLPRISAAVA